MKFPYNLDYSKRSVVDTSKKAMEPSGLSGVERIPLERERPESGITTSVVRYEAGAAFSEHSHPGGEEIFVLEGEFADEFGVYSAGTYIRNPPGSHHSPFSRTGCKLFVKLNQFQPGDSKRVVIDTTQKEWLPGYGDLKVMPLADFDSESTALVNWPEGAAFTRHTHFGGEEIFVLEGTFIDEKGEYPTGTWIRSPHLSSHDPFVKEGCTILVKTGHMLASNIELRKAC
jgi:anti-sigma factor ChrR (cupin superfamily)